MRWMGSVDEEVKECGNKDWQADRKNGETVLAMYEKLE